MGNMDRRTFLRGSLATAGAFATYPLIGTKAFGANERVRVAIAGLHGRGGNHLSEYMSLPNVEIAYLIDPDANVLANAMKAVAKKGLPEPKAVADVRKALEDKNLDALSIATPNHWHSLMTIWACQAGKHVYVEKPCSHDIFEGRIAVEASRKYNVIVQHGTQQRSSAARAGLMEAIHAGKFGKLIVSHGRSSKARPSIGFKQPSDPPANLDWNLWRGPADVPQYHANFVHYNWHWFWVTGNGEIGNQGVHEMDVARWAIKPPAAPKRAMSIGGRFGEKDQGETPNAHFSIIDYGDGRYIMFTIREMVYPGYKGDIRNDFYFEECRIVDGKLYQKGSDTPERFSVPAGKVTPGGPFGAFIAALKANKREMTNGDILDAHLSCIPIHLANISYRLGEKVPFSKQTKAFGDNKIAYDLFAEMHDIMEGGCKLPVDGTQYICGPWLEFDADKERFVGERADEANALLRGKNRKGFEVPEKDKV